MKFEEKPFICEQFDTNVTKPEFPLSLEKHIRNIIVKENYLKYDVNIKEISTNGGNYLASLYVVDIKGITTKGNKEINIFIKKMKPDENKLKIISIPEAYKTEIFAYKELKKIYTKLQDEAKIPIDEIFKMVKDFGEFDPQAIILENLTKKGYKTTHRMDVVSLEYAEIAVKHLAKFHALSFALQEKNPEYFNANIKPMKSGIILGDDWTGFVKSIQGLSLSFLSNNLREKVEKILPNLFNKLPEYFEGDSTIRCLCHGDYRPNNILMKEINGDLTDLIPIDYQLLYYGCPILDFLYFMFTGTDKKFRAAHLEHLKALYHDTMRNYLEYFDIDIETVYPRMAFEEDYKKRLDYGLVVVLIYCPFMFVDEDDVPDITEVDLDSISFRLHETYKERLEGAIEDFVEWGFL